MSPRLRHVSRVLILTASVGEGHDLPARTLAAQLRERPGVEVIVVDGLRAMGRAFVLINEQAPGVVFHRLQWLWDASFWLFVGFAPTRRATQALVRLAGSRGIERLVRRVRPDVIVSVYPMTTEVLAGLRRRGRIGVPVVAAITDLAMMHYWTAPAIDLNLVIHAESYDEVRAVAGADARVEVVHGLTRPEFCEACAPADARARLGLAVDGKIVLVSGGGWGVGDLEGAVRTALELPQTDLVVCLCGRNEDTRRRLDAAFAREPRVRVLGFTEQISDWLAAGDALVHSTGGLTVYEAYVRGCPTISYGWGRGHIRAHNEAFLRHGIADVAIKRDELRASLERVLAQPRQPGFDLTSLPSAASLVLELA